MGRETGKRVATANVQRFKLFAQDAKSSRDFPQLGNCECSREGGGKQKEKNLAGIKRVRKTGRKGEKYHITSLYRVSEAGTRVCSGSSIRF